MIRQFLCGKLCALYICLFMIGFFIGYSFSITTSRNQESNSIHISDIVEKEDTTLLNDGIN